MKNEIYILLKNLNDLAKSELVRNDLQEYINKIYSIAKIISYHENGELIGFIAYYDNDESKEYAYLTMLAVNPEYQGRGYGKRLLQNMIEYLKELRFKRLKLEVLKKDKKVIEFYKIYGFVLSQTKEDTHYMIKEL